MFAATRLITGALVVICRRSEPRTVPNEDTALKKLAKGLSKRPVGRSVGRSVACIFLLRAQSVQQRNKRPDTFLRNRFFLSLFLYSFIFDFNIGENSFCLVILYA